MRTERQLARLKAQLAKLDLLILDELGYVPASKVGAELLLDVISTAYERSSVLVTTNLPFEEWTEVLGERAADGRDAGPPDASLHHGRDGEGELPAERCAAASPRRGGRPSTPGRPRSNLVSPGDPLFDRPAYVFRPPFTSTTWRTTGIILKYDEYLAAGYPIGSGVAEGACRHLVKDRLKQTGMRWTVAGAQAMLHVRALYLNDQWEEFVEYRIGREQAGLYGRNAA